MQEELLILKIKLPFIADDKSGDVHFCGILQIFVFEGRSSLVFGIVNIAESEIYTTFILFSTTHCTF